MEVEWQTAGLPALKSGFESRHPLRRPAWGARFRRDGRDAAKRERATGTRRPARLRQRADEDEILNALLRARLTTKRFFKARPGIAPGWTAMQTVAYLLGHRASLQR